jgi:hypothetical protein
MNGYICFYNGKRIEVKAETSGDARIEAKKLLKPRKSRRYQVSVHLAERYDDNGKVIPVVHTPDL